MRQAMMQQEFCNNQRNMLVIWKEFILGFIQESDSGMPCLNCEWVRRQECFLDSVCLQCHDYIDGNGSEIPLVMDICRCNLILEVFWTLSIWKHG